MLALDPRGVLRAWEAGREQHPVDRALTLLLAAEPGGSRVGLARLSVLERDRRLFALRARTLGPALGAFSVCPACGERVEFATSTEALCPPAARATTWEAEVGGRTVRFRLPDSLDLAAAVRCGRAAEARRVLAERCRVPGSEDDQHATEPLDDDAVAALALRMAEVAPGAEVLFDLGCPACGTRWREGLDIGEFFWRELSALARRILREVDALARAYHWPEAEILSMSAARRQSYLEMVGG